MDGKDLEVKKMSDFNLVGVIKVMPTDPDVNLDELEAAIRKTLEEKFGGKYGISKIERQPIAFGLVALKVYVLGKDAEGYSFDEVAEAFAQLENVESAEVETVSRF
ncbi:MAG: Elongation factor 1-beta [Thermococcales archaeon 44_46]|nr:MAG: Elongation factor 1-beta [Thermococcales archaeon 44_46]